MQGSRFPTLVRSLIALSAIIVTNCAFCQHIPTLTTDDGSIYRDVEIKRVTADGIAIIHSTGASTVKFDELTKNVSSLPETVQKAAQNYLQHRTTKLREPQTAPSKNPSSQTNNSSDDILSKFASAATSLEKRIKREYEKRGTTSPLAQKFALGTACNVIANQVSAEERGVTVNLDSVIDMEVERKWKYLQTEEAGRIAALGLTMDNFTPDQQATHYTTIDGQQVTLADFKARAYELTKKYLGGDPDLWRRIDTTPALRQDSLLQLESPANPEVNTLAVVIWQYAILRQNAH